MQLIDGKKVAGEIKQEIAAEVEKILAAGGRRPHLAAILVGHDGGSETYVANKVKACAECGFTSSLIRFEDDVTEETLLAEIARLNENPEIDGFIVQLPLPRHISEQRLIEAIDYRKDVDGFHPINVGRQSIGLPCFRSATPAGIMTLLERYGINTSGANCVVGNATVTVCHRDTRNIKEVCREADIVIAAMGRPESVTADMVKDGATVIDVGTTRVPDETRKSGFRLCGDVKFAEVAPKCAYITPVPGGVGPMTIVSLMLNTLAAAKHEIYA